MNSKITYIIFALSVLFSCKKEVTIKTVDIKGETIDINFSEIFDSLYIVPLETEYNNPIGEINQIIKTNKNIIINDARKSKSIFIYDSLGNLKTILNAEGKGPSQFIEPRGITYDHKTNHILVDDVKLRKILFFDLAGNFIKEHQLPVDMAIRDIICTRDKIFMLNYIEKNEYKILVYDRDFNLVNRYLPFEYKRSLHVAFNYFFPDYENNNSFYYVEPNFNTLYKVDNNRAQSFCSFDFGNSSEEENKVRKMNSSDVVFYLNKNNHFKYMDDRVVDGKDILLFSIGNSNKGFGLLYKKTMKALKVRLYNDMDGLISFAALPYNYNIIPNHITFSMSPDEFKESLLQARKNKNIDDELFNKFNKISNNMNSYDNPILLFYKFNKNINLDKYFR